MPTEGAVTLAIVVGICAFGAGALTAMLVFCAYMVFRPDPEPAYEAAPISQEVQEAQDRIAEVHRQAHEKLATTVLQGAQDQAEFDELLRVAGESGQPGADR